MRFKQTLWGVFYLFGFVALIFEPLYYFGCNWDLNLCPTSRYMVVQLVGEIWKIYCKWDPLFIAPPLWLRVLCTIEVVLFGPLYIICAYGIQKNKKWLSLVAFPFCGALVYGTIVYFAMEVLDPLPGTNMVMVFIVNIPWTIFPIILMYSLYNITISKIQ